MQQTEALDPQGLFGFWKNLTLIVIFITLTPIALGTSLFSLYSINKDVQVQQEIVQKAVNLIESPKSGVRVYASLPEEPKQISTTIVKVDARAEIVRAYLDRYESPLYTLADSLVTNADKYGLDYRLLTAIAQQESNLCKKIPYDTFNCWGWGIHSEGTLGFNSYQEGIETVSKGLKEAYIDKGYTTPELIMTKYTPSSPNGAWAKGVLSFMEEMQ
ncbi:MAG: hypothetical protein AAB546_02965 [Patescibacteria group bacterium]